MLRRRFMSRCDYPFAISANSARDIPTDHTYSNVFVGQNAAQAGSFPPHRSHLTATPLVPSCAMCPNGHTIEHRPHPMQRVSLTMIAPVASLRAKAVTGHAFTHAASSHWKHVTI